MFITISDIPIYYEKTGTGPPLVLLHGNGEDHHIFDPLCKKLAPHFTVYAPDTRGHGQSGKTDHFSYTAMAEDLRRFIEALGIAPANVVGFSDGAITALLLAMAHPALLGRMALLGPNLSPADFRPKVLEKLQDTYRETGDPLYKLMLTEPDIKLDDLRRVKTPALVIYAERDICEEALFLSIAGAMPNAAALSIPGHNHLSYVVGEDMLFPDLLAFFAGGDD